MTRGQKWSPTTEREQEIWLEAFRAGYVAAHRDIATRFMTSGVKPSRPPLTWPVRRKGRAA